MTRWRQYLQNAGHRGSNIDCHRQNKKCLVSCGKVGSVIPKNIIIYNIIEPTSLSCKAKAAALLHATQSQTHRILLFQKCLSSMENNTSEISKIVINVQVILWPPVFTQPFSRCYLRGLGENRKLKDKQKIVLGTLSLQGILVKPGRVNRVQTPYTPVSKAPKQADSSGWGLQVDRNLSWSCRITSIASSIANRNSYFNTYREKTSWATSEQREILASKDTVLFNALCSTFLLTGHHINIHATDPESQQATATSVWRQIKWMETETIPWPLPLPSSQTAAVLSSRWCQRALILEKEPSRKVRLPSPVCWLWQLKAFERRQYCDRTLFDRNSMTWLNHVQ